MLLPSPPASLSLPLTPVSVEDSQWSDIEEARFRSRPSLPPGFDIDVPALPLPDYSLPEIEEDYGLPPLPDVSEEAEPVPASQVRTQSSMAEHNAAPSSRRIISPTLITNSTRHRESRSL